MKFKIVERPVAVHTHTHTHTHTGNLYIKEKNKSIAIFLFFIIFNIHFFELSLKFYQIYINIEIFFIISNYNRQYSCKMVKLYSKYK